jgi:hypothetical protein
MSVGGSKERPQLLALMSLLLALMTVSAAFYQNYIYTRQLEAVQRNVTRGEFIRTCRDVIEAYFQVKLRVSLMVVSRGTSASQQSNSIAMEAANAVSRLGALGTYLANFQDEGVRYRYTMLTRELTQIVMTAQQDAQHSADALFVKADELFTGMNDDCTRLAKAVPLS